MTICAWCETVISNTNPTTDKVSHGICRECFSEIDNTIYELAHPKPKKVILPYCYEIDRDRGYWIVFDEWGNPVESFGQEEDAWDLTEHLNKEAGYGNASGIHGNVNC